MSVNDAMQYEMLCRREFGDFGMGSCSLADRLRISHTGNVFYKNSLVIKSSYILISKQPMSMLIPSKIFSIPVLGAYMRKMGQVVGEDCRRECHGTYPQFVS